jgi:hypothetical protein
MKRIVVDKNMLEDSKNLGAKYPLRAWLAASKDHIVVVTDHAHLEMLKGGALKNILKSTEILAECPKQVHIVKSITAVSALKGKDKGEANDQWPWHQVLPQVVRQARARWQETRGLSAQFFATANGHQSSSPTCLKI